jgi:hypothetical protein
MKQGGRFLVSSVFHMSIGDEKLHDIIKNRLINYLD